MLEEERRRAKSELEQLRRALRTSTGIADVLERDVELGFNPFWGLMFKEGNENSRFGSQVEQYACLYTSRASNFLYVSPMQYLRAQRDRMPHEMGGCADGAAVAAGERGAAEGRAAGLIPSAAAVQHGAPYRAADSTFRRDEQRAEVAGEEYANPLVRSDDHGPHGRNAGRVDRPEDAGFECSSTPDIDSDQFRTTWQTFRRNPQPETSVA